MSVQLSALAACLARSSRRSDATRLDPSGPTTRPTWAAQIRLEPTRSTPSTRLWIWRLVPPVATGTRSCRP